MKKNPQKLQKNSDEKNDLILREMIRLEKETEFGFTAMKKDFTELQGAVDTYAKKADTYFQEMMMLAHKFIASRSGSFSLLKKQAPG